MTAPVALVTGAGRNIGRAVALALAADGFDLGVLTRSDRAAAEAVAGEVRALGRRARVAIADVRDPGAVTAAHESIADALGPIGVLVNNAAVRREQIFTEITARDWQEILSTVLDGAFHCSAAVLPAMVESGTGQIVNIVGVTGQTGASRRAHVVTAKAGLIGLTRALATEYADRGIRVNAVSPGLVDTTREGVPDPHRGRPIPVGRAGTPAEVAGAVRYLVSPEAGFVTGETLNVNGGIRME